jgi:hypothetical protein
VHPAGSKGDAADVKALKAAGYREQTPFDDHLRREIGEHRWAMYVADPARVVCAALITDGDKAGYDMTALLRKVAIQRAWEDDARSPAKSIARVLAFRIKRELDRPTYRRSEPAASAQADNHVVRTSSRASTKTIAPAGAGASRPQTRGPQKPSATEPMPVTPYDARIRDLLGQQRWEQFATDKRRRDVAGQLTAAAADGHDVEALITHAVTCRKWEDDPRSPSRGVGGVLRHRIQAAIASGEFRTAASGSELPSGVAQVVASAAAPASSSQVAPGRTHPPDQARPPAHGTQAQPGRGRG